MTPASIALNRFGLGARPDEPAPADPHAWLLSQLDRYEPRPKAWQQVPGTSALVRQWVTQQRDVQAAPEGLRSGIREAYLRTGRDAYLASAGARMTSALETGSPFIERMVHFWANHFAVSVDKLLVIGLAGSMEADAIRPYALGRFDDLLLAVARHPAMLLYLDQARSTGPNSRAGQRTAGRPGMGAGLNENLAREILELHTLGVRSGYTQADVTELARALTGWTLPGDEALDGDGVTFRFIAALHEPGSRTVLGRVYPEGGEDQAAEILRDLARRDATARHIATKLARHVVADDPPPELVQRLADTFTRTGGDLRSVYRELITAPEGWAPSPAKFKSPWDWTVSSLRAMGKRNLPANQATNLLSELGQPIWRPGSPAGYGDVAATWAAPDALLRRVEMAQRLVADVGDTLDARELAPRVLPGSVAPATAQGIARAESPATALALLLSSPDFLRR